MVPGSFVTTEDGTGLVHLAPAFGADDMERRGRTGCRWSTRSGRTGGSRTTLPLVGGMFFKDADQRLIEDLADRGLLFASHAARAQLSALLAVRHVAAVLRAALVVHQDHRDQGPAARAERADELVSGHGQAGPVRRVAAQQRGLGAVPDPVLGHAAAAVGMRGEPT